jgi:glycosyltransferase involved in cell wall biosynthesis
LKRHVLALTERTTYAMATHLTCNSIGLRSWVEENFSPRRMITVVGAGSINGVDVDRFTAASEEARHKERRRLGIDDEATVYLFLGRLVHAKGVEELLQSFDILRQARDHLVLLIVGDQEKELDPLSAWAVNRLTADAGVIHLGWRDDVKPVFAAADVCVLPSHREGLPNILLEAAACGLPVVASDINGCNEVVEHGRTGILVPTKDIRALYRGLLTLLNPATRLSMGRAARERVVALYEHEAFCRALVAYYTNVLSSTQVPRNCLAQAG